jgi:hypothetical protein
VEYSSHEQFWGLPWETVVRRIVLVLAVCFCSLQILAAGKPKDDDLTAYLAGVTERGRDLYAYDQAAWHGTDAFLELKPNTEGLAHYICVKGANGWVITFPKWNATHDKLLIAYEALQSAPGKYQAHAHDQPLEASGALVAMELALELVIADFGTPNRPYNTAILAAPAGNFYVYLYPAQTKDTVWPLGGDVRYAVSSDGKQIIEKRQLHKTILDLEFPPDKHPVAGYHVHVLSNVPEDTDVLNVLNRRPPIPEYIGTQKQKFVVQVDGSIIIGKK